VPQPFARHATGGGTIATPWLFPGYRPGKHLDAQSNMIRLRWLGINLLGARNSALGNLVAEVSLPWSPNSSATATKSPGGTRNSLPNHGRDAPHSGSPDANTQVPVENVFSCCTSYFGL